MTGEPEELNFDFMIPALVPSSTAVDTGTVKKNKKKFIEKDENVKNNHKEKRDVLEDSLKKVDCSENQSKAEKTSVSQNSMEPNINLSRDELLKLLSVFEGELQARDEVIAILKSECSQNTDTRYGLASQPFKALQRDAATLEVTSEDYVCEQTKEQLKKIIQHQKASYKRLKQMQLSSEEKYHRLSSEMEEEKRKHQEYMLKSDDFVNLLEHDRERLKQMLEQEKSTHDQKERELARKLRENKEEASQLKTLSLELVEERQQQLQTVNDQKQLVTTLRQQLEEAQLKVQEAEKVASSEKEHAVQLENELEEQTNSFYKEHESLNETLAAEQAKTKKLEEKVKSLGRQMNKLKCVDKNLRKTDDQLWRIKEKLEQEERYEDLLEEVELLRKTVAGMQEAEKIYTQAQEECKELRETLEKEVTLTKTLRDEVEKLRKSTRNRTEMERCVEEAIFRFDEIKHMFDAECKKVLKMRKQIEDYRERLMKMDESQSLLMMSEERLVQLQEFVRELKEDKVGLEATLQLEKDKSSQYKDMLEDEKSKFTVATQKTIDESKKLFKLREQMTTLETKRKDELAALQSKLESAETSLSQMITKEKAGQMEALITNLRKQVAMLKKRLDQLENETDMKENEARIAKEEAEKARQNLNTSTEKLKKLVALGLNEQIVIAQTEDCKEKYLHLERTNADLRQEIKSLEFQLQQSRNESNTNSNNNISLKGIPVSHVSTQTSTTNKEVGSHSPSGGRDASSKRASTVVNVTNSSSGSLTRASTIKEAASNKTTKTSEFTATGSSTKVNVTSQRKTTSVSSIQRNLSGVMDSGRPPTITQDGRSILVHLNQDKDRTSSNLQPVSMTISHDPSTDCTPSFRIVRDSKTGDSHIETVTDTAKKIKRVRTSVKADSSSAKSRPPPASNVANRTSLKGTVPTKITSKVTVTPSNSNRTRSESNNKKTQLDRRSSISPTRIPKFRSGTPTPSTPKPSTLPRTTSQRKSDR